MKDCPFSKTCLKFKKQGCPNSTPCDNYQQREYYGN